MHQPEFTPRPVPLTIALGSVVAIVLAATAIVGEVVLWFRSGFGLVVVLSVIIALAVIAGCWFSGLRVRRGFVPGEGIVWAVLGMVLWVQRVSTFGWPELTPHAFSMDAAHHGAIARWILENQQIPTGPVESLGTFAEYPNGSHVALAVWSWVTGMSIWQSLGAMTLSLICLLIVMLGTAVAAVLEHQGRRYIPRLAAGSVVVFAVLAHRFTFGMAVIDFFFSQLMAFVVVTVGLLVGFRQAQSGKLKASGLNCGVAVLSAGSAVMYPLQIALLPAAFMVGAVFGRNRSGQLRRQWRNRGLVSAISTAAAIALTTPRLGEAAEMRLAEGYIAKVTQRSVGGFGGVLLAALGTIVLTSGFVRRSRHDGDTSNNNSTSNDPISNSCDLDGVLLCALIAVGQYVAMLSAHRFGLFGLSNYSATKTAYWIVWLGIALAAVAIGQLLVAAFPSKRSASTKRAERALDDTLEYGKRAYFRPTVASIVALLLVGLPAYRLGTSRPTLSNIRVPMATLDAIAFSRQAAEKYGIENIAIMGDELSPYAMLLVGAGSALGPGRFELSGRNIPWQEWPAESVPHDYLIVDGLGMEALFANRPGVELVNRRGQIVLLRRAELFGSQP